MIGISTAGPYTDVVSALLQTFFPAVHVGTEEEKRPFIANFLRTPGNDDPDIAAEVRLMITGPCCTTPPSFVHVEHRHMPLRLTFLTYHNPQVLRTLRVLPPESQRDLFL